ncbi:Glycosyltransferase family 1 protein [Mycena sanguinolenta]|uniref:sucrose-phosphate synthase n=1 Tax=Mycena sanguinolenta TaxID=230812 RepID=A0A8H6U408_9AGAR|nr:Glycosyltransferase family 1 protein [Mycena sanguinolenta]
MALARFFSFGDRIKRLLSKKNSFKSLHLVFLNPQGNFDNANSGIGEHPDFGGQLIYVREICASLARHGINVDIVTRQFVDERWPTFAKTTELLLTHTSGQVRIIRVPCGPDSFLRKEDLWPHLESWVYNIAAFYAREGQLPDASTGHYGDGGLACAMLEDISKIPFASFTAHSLGAQKRDIIIKEGQDLADFNFPSRLEAECRSLRAAFRIIVSTNMERCEQYAHPAYKNVIDVDLDPARFVFIPPGVNLDIFGPDIVGPMEEPSVKTFIEALARDIPAHRHHLPIVIAAGRLDFKKNHISIVQAFANHDKLRHNANLLMLIKGGPQAFQNPEACFTGEELQIATRMMKIMQGADMAGTCVIVPGLQNTQPELAAIFRHLRRTKQGIFCHPAHYEPFGLMVLEAIAAGIPAVCTQNGGPIESLKSGDEQYAMLVDPSNIDEIATCLYKLVSSPTKWQEYQTKSQKHVLDNYSWDAAADRYLKVIFDMIADRCATTTAPSVPFGFSTLLK